MNGANIMPRYVALLRGVSPTNANMTELRSCFESLGLTDVKTVLATGNVAFNSPMKSESALVKLLEKGMAQHLPHSFDTIVRKTDYLKQLLQSDPFAPFDIPPKAKRVITFLRQAYTEKLALPIELDNARILAIQNGEVFTAYEPHEKGPRFMVLIERTFGKSVTTRTLLTVEKCAAA